jgi:hypothetical protein
LKPPRSKKCGRTVKEPRTAKGGKGQARAAVARGEGAAAAKGAEPAKAEEKGPWPVSCQGGKDRNNFSVFSFYPIQDFLRISRTTDFLTTASRKIPNVKKTGPV